MKQKDLHQYHFGTNSTITLGEKKMTKPEKLKSLIIFNNMEVCVNNQKALLEVKVNLNIIKKEFN